MATAEVAPETLKPGLYPGLTFSEYHALDAISHSRLEPFKRTPAHARETMLHPRESTAALALGHAFHEFVLEEAQFLSHYVVPPKVDRRTTVGKETWAAFERDNPGKTPLSSEELQQYEGMRASILAHPLASELLNRAIAKELSFVWEEQVPAGDGLKRVPCKGREDILAPYGGYAWIVNLKTSKDASERSFARDIAAYGYHRASAWYRRGLAAAVGPAPRRVAYLVVEKEPPYCVAVHELDDRAIDQGEREMLRYLSLYVACEESGVYPGYDEGLSLIDLPPWAVDTLDK